MPFLSGREGTCSQMGEGGGDVSRSGAGSGGIFGSHRSVGMIGLVALGRALAAGAETDSACARVMVRNKSWAR